jgi:spore germination protein GerM
MSRIRALAVLVVVLGAVLVACGVPSEEEPRDLAAESVQFDLLEPSSSTTATTAAPADVRTVDVFLLRNDQLTPVRRDVSVDIEAGGVVAELLEPLSEDETEDGYGTAIPEGTELHGARLDGTTLTLNLGEELNTVQGERQTIAIAQIVFTATELRSVTGVRFQIEGTPVEVPKGDGTLTSSPLKRSDYPDLDPERNS